VEGQGKLIVEKQEVNMTEDEMKAMLEKVASDAADAAVKKYSAENQPDILAGVLIDVTEDETDRKVKSGSPFKSAGEFLTAVKDAACSPTQIDKRLLAMKSNGMNEAIPSQGGFLVQQDMADGIMTRMYSTGSVLARFNPITVSGNGLLVNVLDETSSRADGYRHGGLLGYWLEEGGTKTATKPKFRQLDLKLKKVCAACYATDELLEDATALESWLTQEVPTELRFQVEAAIINGNGVGKPLGILQSGAYYELARVDANEIDATDVSNMWAHRYAGVNDYVWFVSTTIFPQLQTMAVGQMPVYMPPGGMSSSPYGSLFGRPVIETEYNPSLGISGDILLASPSQYTFITKGGVQSASSIHVAFMTDESVYRFVFRCDGESNWAGKMASYYASSDYFSPFVGLSASS
jgi:HK97 family phage major capsid protein